MKQKPRWTLEMLIAALAVLCALLTLALLVQRPAGWPALAVLVVLWGIGICGFRYQLRRWTAKWVAGGSFENSRTQYSLESLSQPAALLSGETVLWYNSRFRTALLGGEGASARVSTPEEAAEVWQVHRVSPMAANGQCIFFRNPAGDVLVSILHYERDA